MERKPRYYYLPGDTDGISKLGNVYPTKEQMYACVKHIAYANKYYKTCSELESLALLQDVEEHEGIQVAKTEYGVGANIPRGYYCPDPMAEIVGAELNRGELVNPPGDAKSLHIFDFDSDNRLIRCRYMCKGELVSDERIFYISTGSYSITSDKSGNLIALTRCVYEDDRIKQYVNLNCFGVPLNMEFDSLTVIDYTYEGVGISEMAVSTYLAEAREYKMESYSFQYEGNTVSFSRS